MRRRVEEIQQAGLSAMWFQLFTSIASIPTCPILEDLFTTSGYSRGGKFLPNSVPSSSLSLSLSLYPFPTCPPSVSLCFASRRDTMHLDRPGLVQYWNHSVEYWHISRPIFYATCSRLSFAFRAAAADGSAESTAIYTFRLDGSHSAPICDAGSCEPKPRAERAVEGPRRGLPSSVHVTPTESCKEKQDVIPSELDLSHAKSRRAR